MKLELENRTTQVFISVLVITALLINWYFWGRNQSRGYYQNTAATPPSQPSRPQNNSVPTLRQTEPATPVVVDSAAAAREVAQAAEARKQYLARYLNAGIQRKSGVNLVAVVAASEDGKIERDLMQALSSHLKTNGVEIVDSFFKPELLSDRLLDDLFSESTQLRQKLELDKSLDGLILARVAVEYVSNPSLQNVITARLSLDVAAQAMDASGASKTWTLTVSGAGFDRKTARAMAGERILKAISADTKMSLNPIIASQ
jgi:hypothetical protein